MKPDYIWYTDKIRLETDRTKTGKITSEIYTILSGEKPNNWNFEKTRIYHREDGPAFVSYFEDGTIMHEFWYRNGSPNNPIGPACVSYNQAGKVVKKSYFIMGYGKVDEAFFRLHCLITGNAEGLNSTFREEHSGSV